MVEHGVEDLFIRKIVRISDCRMKLHRNENETWLEAALRLAKPWKLEEDVKIAYEKNIENGNPEDYAALFACEEWDILEPDPGHEWKKDKNGVMRQYWHGRPVLSPKESAEMDFPYPPEDENQNPIIVTEKQIKESTFDIAKEIRKVGAMKQDSRLKKGGWAPGSYQCKCHRCSVYFIGDKHAVTCADCAYNKDDDSCAKDGAEASRWAMKKILEDEENV